MDDIIFCISHEGRHLFSTTAKQGLDAARAEAHIVAKFPASEGYKVQREVHPATFTYSDITGAA